MKNNLKKFQGYNNCAIKTGDLVQVIAGKEKKKKGKVIDFDRKTGYVKIEGLKMQTHFKKGSGMIVKEGGIHISNVMLVDENNTITRYKFSSNEKGKKQRIAVTTGAVL
jgi:large subunit ribosomal protein L24